MASAEVKAWLHRAENHSARNRGVKRNGKLMLSVGSSTAEIMERAEQFGMRSGKMPVAKRFWRPRKMAPVKMAVRTVRGFRDMPVAPSVTPDLYTSLDLRPHTNRK